MEKQKPRLRQTTVRIPEDMLKAAKIWAVEYDTSLQEMIVQGLAAVLTSFEKESAAKRAHKKEAKS